MPSWPPSLPSAFETGGFQRSFADLAERSKMDKGPDLVRRITTAGVEPMRGAMIMTHAQLAMLRTFYFDDLAVVAPFDFLDTTTMETISLRFVSPPSYTYRSPGTWRVNLDLEVMP